MSSGDTTVQTLAEENLGNHSQKEECAQRENYEFEADVAAVMSIIVNSVYSCKDLFLRELVSNASDALTKLLAKRHELEEEGHAVPYVGDLKIRIIPDKESGTLTIQDNGIGMTKAELKEFLGSVATSGTKKFRTAIDSIKDSGSDINSLIGQFGLGFYSAFLVADQVTVLSKSYHDQGYCWVSQCKGSYTIEPRPGVTTEGTTIILYLKKGDEEFLETSRLTDLVKKHSNCIKYPVALITKEVPKVEEKKDEDKVEEIAGENEVAEEGGKAAEDGSKTAEEPAPVPELKEQILNNTISIWDRRLSEVPKEELVKFYRDLSNDYDEFLSADMWKFEGVLNLNIILFFPSRSQMSMFTKPATKSTNVSLFCANVLVSNELPREIVPEWMDFIVAAVSSPDLPMNVSREFLQGSSVMNMIKKELPKCILKMIKSLASDSEKYEKFYEEFSRYLKLAIRSIDDDRLSQQYAACLRYELNRQEEGKSQFVTLDQYLEMVPETQKQILVLTGLSRAELDDSLYLELFKDKLVLLMPSADDEALLQKLTEYKQVPFQMISKEGVEGGVAEEVAEENKEFCEFVKKQLDEKIERVTLSRRAGNVPAVLFATKYAASGTMERLLRAQPKSDKDIFLQMMLRGKQVFELNLENSLVRKLKEHYDSGELEKAKEYVAFMFSAAKLGCGYSLENTGQFMRQIYSLLGDKNE